MAAGPEFKRALLGLHLDAPDQKAIDVAFEMAGRLGLELVGVFAKDDTPRELAGYPGAREFVPAGRTWRPIDPDRMIHEQMLAAQAAQRAFRALASATGIPSTFEIVTGPPTQAFVSMSCASDILVVAEPTQASSLVTRSFSLFFDAAMRSPASVLLVPRSVRRRRGPIVMLGGAPDDPDIAVASAIAAAAHEELVVMDAHRGESIGSLTGRLSTRLGSRSESLIVMTREGSAGEADNLGVALAEAHRVPVLILEPPPRTPVSQA
jgi:hypothetical protein